MMTMIKTHRDTECDRVAHAVTLTLTQTQAPRRWRRHLAVLTLFALFGTWSASAQDRVNELTVPSVLKQVLLDPTTYVPTIVAWQATRLDWQSSQPFFQNGWFERNARFTVSGRSNDTPITYAEGNRQILVDAVANIQLSLINNISARVTERLLIPRYPNHPRLIRAIGWLERSAMASYLTYRLSAEHFRQWQDNERHANELGF